jgi:hypothetical protein
VLPGRSRPFPLEEVRDLLGLTRAIYRARLASGASPGELERIQRIGERLKLALELAANEAGSVGERAAWQHAEKATREIGTVLDIEPAEPIVQAAMRAVSEPRRRR